MLTRLAKRGKRSGNNYHPFPKPTDRVHLGGENSLTSRLHRILSGSVSGLPDLCEVIYGIFLVSLASVLFTATEAL